MNDTATFYEGVEFSDPDRDKLETLHRLLVPGPSRDADAAVAVDIDLVIRMFTALGGGCRLAFPDAEIFEVTNDGRGDLVQRCTHDSYHEWVDGKRVK